GPPGAGCTTAWGSCGKCLEPMAPARTAGEGNAYSNWARGAAAALPTSVPDEADVSETSMPVAAGTPKSLPARLFGVLLAPRATYAEVAARPRWFGALAFVIVVGALATSVFMSTEVGRQAALDQQTEFMKAL